MTSLQQIEEAIRILSPHDREKLIHDLPSLLPELKGDAAWSYILKDSMARPALVALLNETDSAYGEHPKAFPELKAGDFDAKP